MHSMSRGIQWWFESIDNTRRRRGAAMDRVGLGPKEMPHRVILERPGLRLRFYGGRRGRPVALLIPAPIKRYYIWDMLPHRSVVRHALEEDFRVFLVEWTDPVGEVADYGLEDYAATLLDACAKAIREVAGTDRLFLLGHSLGGVLAAIYAALRPERTAALATIEAPLHFGEASGSFLPLLVFGPRAPAVAAWFNTIPGSLLSIISISASPTSFALERYADLVKSMRSAEALRGHLLVQRWTLDEAPMSRRLFEDVVERLYREDRFMRGTLTIAGKRLGPHDIRAPFLAVWDPRSLIVPPASVIDFVQAAGSKVKCLLQYEGDVGVALAHVGAMMGENAHRHLWPQIFEWLQSLEAVPHHYH